MAAFSFLVAWAVAASAQGHIASSDLYALNAVPATELGRFYDSAARAPWAAPEAARQQASVSIVVGPPAAATVVAPAERRPPAKVPFVLPIPDVPPPAYERSFRRLLKRPQTSRYDEAIEAQAAARGLDARLVKSIIAAESEFSSQAHSSAGAIGLMQVMPRTAGAERRALLDPLANLAAGTAYLAYLFRRAWKRYHLEGVAFTRAPGWLIQRVIAAYNAGPRFLARRRLYRQTREYIFKVLLYYRSGVSELRGH